ncbi:hypothetical protein BH09BAC2_BH09BAC2_20540 [soil metagenome]
MQKSTLRFATAYDYSRFKKYIKVSENESDNPDLLMITSHEPVEIYLAVNVFHAVITH